MEPPVLSSLYYRDIVSSDKSHCSSHIIFRMRAGSAAFDAFNSAVIRDPRLVVKYTAVYITFLITIIIDGAENIFLRLSRRIHN
jgi:hypothetical protein